MSRVLYRVVTLFPREPAHELRCHGLAVTEVGQLPEGIVAQLRRAKAEVERLRGWLLAIDGGDHPCTDEVELRRMAYRAVVLGHPAPRP